MGLARHISPVRFRAVVRYWQVVCVIAAAAMLPPLGVAAFLGEWDCAVAFGGVAIAAAAIGFLGSRKTAYNLDIREASVVTALAYLSFALFGTVPYLIVTGPVNALFESMSGITTTGLSVLDPTAMPTSLVFFRAWSQWIGGAGIIILSVAVVFGTGRSVVEFHRAEFGDREIIGSVVRTARTVAVIYLIVTAVAFAALMAAGVGLFDAVVHTFTSVSTGGFSPHATGDPYHGAFALALIPLMLLGATGFSFYHHLRTEGFGALRHDIQPLVMLGFAGGAIGLLYAVSTGFRAAPGEGAFHVVSALTTTGYSASDPNSWSPGLWSLVLLAMIVGGSSASTAGGLKLWRVIIAAKSMAMTLIRSSLPREAVTPLRYRSQPVDSDDEHSVLVYLALYLTLLAVSALIFSLAGYRPSAALFECASALGTVGMSTGITSPDLNAGLKGVLIVDMWAGRLEIIPVLLTFYYRTWWHKGERS